MCGDVHEWRLRCSISPRDESRVMKHWRRARRCLRKVRLRFVPRMEGRGAIHRLDNNRDIMTTSHQATMFIGDLSHLHAGTSAYGHLSRMYPAIGTYNFIAIAVISPICILGKCPRTGMRVRFRYKHAERSTSLTLVRSERYY